MSVTPSLSEGMFLHKLHRSHIHLGGCQAETWKLKVDSSYSTNYPCTLDLGFKLEIIGGASLRHSELV